jgi:hypothetical protein
VTRKAPAAWGFGVRIDSIEDLDRALSGVMLDLIHLRLQNTRRAEERGQGLPGSFRQIPFHRPAILLRAYRYASLN